MSFAAEIKDFVSGFQAGFNLDRRSRKDREAEEDEANVKAAGDKAADAIGSYGGAASTARPAPTASTDAPNGGASAPSYNPAGTMPTFAGLGDASDVMARSKQAVGGIESGERYNIVGPTHPKYGRALGKYQVMESNLPQWSQDALGRQVSADEFLKTPEIQDKIFENRFGKYLHQTGSVAGAASMWHSGRPLAKAAAAGARDSLGTKTTDYARRVQQSVMGPRAEAAIPDDQDDQGAPTQMAADGGRIRSADEIEEVQTRDPEVSARMRRPADAPWMSRRMPETGTQGPGNTAEAIPSDPEANEVTPARTAIPEAQAQAPIAVHTEGPDGTQRAQTTDTVETPVPPQRPSDAELQVKQNVPLPPKRPDDVSVTEPGNKAAIPDNGAVLPGEGMQPGNDAPANVQSRADVMRDPHITAQATKGALDFIGEFLGLNKAALPGATQHEPGNLRQLTQNAATTQEVAAVDRTVDPHGQMNDAARAIARLNAGYDYYLQKGEPQKALKYAASMVLYARSHSMMAGQIAAQALQRGNVPVAAQAIVEAHNQLPDGKAIQIKGVDQQGVSYAVVDTDGNLTDQGRANLDQMMHLATGMQNGSVWLQQMGELTRVLPKAPTASQKLAERKYADKQAQQERDDDAINGFDASNPDSQFLNSMTEEQRTAWQNASPRAKNQIYRRYKDQRDANLRESKELSKTQAHEKAAQDEQEFSAYANRIDDAQHELDQLDPNDVQNTAAIEAAKQKLAEAKAAGLKWAEADGGRAKYGQAIRGGRLGGSGSRSGGGAGRQAIPLGGEYGSPPKGATKEQKDEVAFDAEVKRGRNDMMRDGGLLQPKAVEKFDLTRADVEFRKAYGKEADLEVQKAVDDLIPKEVQGQDRMAMRHVAEQIAGANGMLPDEALAVTKEALSNGGNFTVTQDGKIQFGSSPPVRLGRAGVLALAGIVKRQKDAAGQGAPTTTENPFQRPSPARERMEAEDRAQAERDAPRLKHEQQKRTFKQNARRRQALGDDYRPGMTADEQRRALDDHGIETARKDRKTYGGPQGGIFQ